MEQAVDEVKLAPLGCGQWAEDRMVQQFPARSKFLFAACDDVIHLGDLWPNVGQHFLRGHSARAGYGWCFPAGRQVAESDDDQGPRSLRPTLPRRQGLAGLVDTLESFD